MADTNRHLTIPARLKFPGETHLPARDEAEPTRPQAHSALKNLDAEKTVRALIAVYLRPPTHISSCFHCW
jgi:hypothetical protein